MRTRFIRSQSSRRGSPTVLTLAYVIQSERAFDLLPVLGDAIQDVGCDRAEVLDHCYGPVHMSLGVGSWIGYRDGGPSDTLKVSTAVNSRTFRRNE